MNDALEKAGPWIALLGRVMIAAIFVTAGWSKIGGYAGTQAYMQSAGVPGALLPLVIALELGGGIAIAGGFLFLVTCGAGRISVDALIAARK